MTSIEYVNLTFVAQLIKLAALVESAVSCSTQHLQYVMS